MAKQPRVMLHSAITLCAPEYLIGMQGAKPVMHKEGSDQEVCQFAAEFHKWPVPEHYFKKAFDDMYRANLSKALTAGIVKP